MFLDIETCLASILRETNRYRQQKSPNPDLSVLPREMIASRYMVSTANIEMSVIREEIGLLRNLCFTGSSSILGIVTTLSLSISLSISILVFFSFQLSHLLFINGGETFWSVKNTKQN